LDGLYLDGLYLVWTKRIHTTLFSTSSEENMLPASPKWRPCSSTRKTNPKNVHHANSISTQNTSPLLTDVSLRVFDRKLKTIGLAYIFAKFILSRL